MTKARRLCRSRIPMKTPPSDGGSCGSRTDGRKPKTMNDFKFAVRQLIKSPGFTAAAVLTLGLAIGVTTAIFALVNSAILKPIAAKDPDSIVAVFTGRKGVDGGYRQFSHEEFQSLREAKEVFSDACA